MGQCGQLRAASHSEVEALRARMRAMENEHAQRIEEMERDYAKRIEAMEAAGAEHADEIADIQKKVGARPCSFKHTYKDVDMLSIYPIWGKRLCALYSQLLIRTTALNLLW